MVEVTKSIGPRLARVLGTLSRSTSPWPIAEHCSGLSRLIPETVFRWSRFPSPPHLRIGVFIIASGLFLFACGDPRCKIPDLDCDVIDRACSNRGPAKITILKNIRDVFNRWQKEGMLNSELSFHENVLWNPKKRGIQFVVYEPEERRAALLFEPTEDRSSQPTLTPIPDEAEIRGEIKQIVLAADRSVLANDGQRITKIHPDGKTETIKSISFGELIGLFFNDKKNEIWTVRSKSYQYEDLNRPLVEHSWIGIDATKKSWGVWGETFAATINIGTYFFMIHSNAVTPSGDLWLLGRKVYEGETPKSSTEYRLVFAQKDADHEVTTEVRQDLLEAIGNFFQTAFQGLQLHLLGIDPQGGDLLFRAVKGNKVENWDAGLIAVNPNTLAVTRLASASNFLEAFGIQCDHTSILNYVGADPERAEQVLKNMKIQTLVPTGENDFLIAGGTLIYRMKLPSP